MWLLSPVSMCTATYLLCVKGLPGTSAVSSFFQSSYQLLYFLYFPSIPNLRIKVHSPEESKTAEEGRKMNGEGLMEQKQGVNLGNRTGQAHGRGTPGSSRGSRDSGVALRPVVRWEGQIPRNTGGESSRRIVGLAYFVNLIMSRGRVYIRH